MRVPERRHALTRKPSTPVAHDYDIIAVGAGTGGLVAAITAAHTGRRALVIEKTSLLGGVTAYSQGQMWAAASDQAIGAGVTDSPAAGYRYLRRLGLGHGDADVTAAFCQLAPEVLRFLTDEAGVPWRLVDLADYYFPVFDDALETGRYLEVAPYIGADLGPWRSLLRVSPHVPYRLTHDVLYDLPCGARSHTWDARVTAEREAGDELAMGTGLAAHLLHAAVELGVDIITDTTVHSLVAHENRVTGVELETDGGRRPVAARDGVVLATGGYDWHPELAREFEVNLGMTSAAPPSIVGDHLRLAGAVGGRLSHHPKAIRLGVRVPGDDDGRPLNRVLGAMAMPHALLVNRDGRRFGDESFYPSIGHAIKEIDGRTQTTPNWPCWMVFDQQFRDRYQLGPVRPGEEFPVEWGVVSASDLDELAATTGIDAAGLATQVERFNTFCDTGHDADFGRGSRPWAQRNYGDPEMSGNPCLGTVAQPPFYALRPGLVGTGIPTLGLATDRHGSVLDHRGLPIAGLYAVGNSSTLHEVGAGYQSGVANTRAAVFAYAAVRHASGDATQLRELEEIQ
ncbi:FAD-dependent oxidoreductase [Nocardioides sediminis]|uniref:FAD-dependent oxidoreductase n=1 Tax=Nocardioides sediminis TaxID=433648 RepID=UPI00131F1C3F|nr:FAD-dependent oxidoreductase [Nocardioides sediminis]